MRLGIFGGTFNPIHNGHIHLVSALNALHNFDRILLIPTNIPPHKSVPDLVDGMHRLAMCKLAAQTLPSIEVSNMELEQQGASYTVYTIRKLRALYPQDKFYYIIGCDMLAAFTKWYKFHEILQEVTLVVGARAQGEYERMLDYANELSDLGGTCIVNAIEPRPMSSTEIRHIAAQGGDITSYVPTAVAQYIKEHRLY